MDKSNFQTLYTFDISEKFGSGYVDYMNDLSRMTIIHVMIQFFFFLKDPNNFSLFSEEFTEMMVYILLGVSVYHLIFKKLIKFV